MANMTNEYQLIHCLQPLKS